MRPAAFKLKYVNLTLTVDFAQVHMETIFFNLRLLQTYMFVYTDASTHVSTLTPIYKHTHVSTYTLSLQELQESILEYLWWQPKLHPYIYIKTIVDAVLVNTRALERADRKRSSPASLHG